MSTDYPPLRTSRPTQLSLLKYTWSDILRDLKIHQHQAQILFEEALLSIDPRVTPELEDYQLDELVFLHTLYFQSGLPAVTVKSMLTTLERPYYFTFQEIFWDFGQQRFRWKSEQVRELAPENYVHHIVAFFKDILSACNETDIEDLEKAFERYYAERQINLHSDRDGDPE